MYEVGVVAHFEAAHRLVGDFGPAQRMHGHTYRVESYRRHCVPLSDRFTTKISTIWHRFRAQIAPPKW